MQSYLQNAELLAIAIIYKVAYGHPGVVSVMETPNLRWCIRTFARVRFHILNVVVFVVCAGFCDHVFDALLLECCLLWESSVLSPVCALKSGKLLPSSMSCTA
jgi:hypothetical protein